MAGIGEGSDKKRKLEANEIEIDVSAPEPPSKKALRKAKKKGVDPTSEPVEEQTTKAPAQEESSAGKRSDFGIWIGNLAFSVTKDDLRKFITTNCSFPDTAITRIHMPRNPDKHGKAQNKGFAYVDFTNAKALKEALDVNEQMLVGRRVLIKDAKNYEGRPDKPQEEGQGSAASGRAPSNRIFVGNLSFDVTREALEEHFGQCGTIAHVHMATFQDTGKCKGYAWIHFEELAAAEAAVKGFVMVKEEEDEEEEDSDSEKQEQTKPKKPRQRRVWVNQLLGRRMRMEFAEDPSTRYKKRFGKDGEGKSKGGSEITEGEGGGSHDQSTTTRPKKNKPEYSRYDEGTVQKLSGAIVESQGKKITFD